MLTDGGSIPGRTIETDVCVVGAGPAGLAVGLELDARGVSVCLLESGGLTSAQQPRDLLVGRTDSCLHSPDFLQRSRAVGPGGTARSWEVDVGEGSPFVRYALPDEVDFEPRAIRREAWPFSLRSLDPSCDGPPPYAAFRRKRSGPGTASSRLCRYPPAT